MSLFRHFVETEFYFRLNFVCLFFNLSRKRYFWFPHVLYTSFSPSLCNMHEFLGKCQMHWFFPLGAHHYLLNDCLPGSWWEYFPPALKGGKKKSYLNPTESGESILKYCVFGFKPKTQICLRGCNLSMKLQPLCFESPLR